MKLKTLIFIPILAFSAIFFFFVGRWGARTVDLNLAQEEIISARELSKAIKDKNFTLINVHTPYEGEISRTDSFIQFDEMMASKDKLPEDKNTPIILYCKTGSMSAEALKTLKGMGYKNVKHLDGGMEAWRRAGNKTLDLSNLTQEVLPKEGFELPISWGDLGPKLIETGTIDIEKFEGAVKLTEEQRKILTQKSASPLKISDENSQFVVDFLWAVGLAQKSLVYEEGPFGKEYKNEAGNFASTGGWTLGKEDSLKYLNKHNLIDLDEGEQKRVVKIAKGVFRPCCGNSTWFPDCNHGMAALAAIELMVDKGLSDEEIYKNVLKLNSFWFPDSYLMVATYFARNGKSWKDIDAKEVLGETYSSGQGAAEIYKKVGNLPYSTGGVGGSCGA